MPVETGLMPDRSGYLQETTRESTDSNPSWNPISDTVRRVTATWEINHGQQIGVGDVNISGPVLGPIGQQIAVQYDWNQWLTSGSDPMYDGLIRDSDNRLNNTHSLLFRWDHTNGGNAGGGYREYVYARGAYLNTINIPGSAADNQYIRPTITYRCYKLRPYVIHQPSSSVSPTVESTDSSDTSQTVTLEDEGASTTEDISLNGTTTQTATNSFGNLDVVSLDSETVGDVLVKDGSGNTLMTIYGSDSYGKIEGDLGLPPLGSSGSHPSALNQDYAHFLKNAVDRPDGTSLAEQYPEFNITVNNRVQEDPQQTTRSQHLRAGPQDIQATATMFGETTGVDHVLESLRANQDNIDYTVDPSGTFGELRLTNAYIDDPGEILREAEQTKAQQNVVFVADGLTIDP